MTITLFNADSIPALAPAYRFQWETVQDCFVILYPEGMIKLSQSAGAIMERCVGNKTIAEIITDLQQQFQIEDIEKDVYKFIETAYENGWITTK